MEKNELAPGIISYKNVLDKDIIDNLINDIEEGMSSLNIEWQQSQVQQKDEITIDTNSRDTQILGVSYLDTIIDNFSNATDAFYGEISNIFLEPFRSREQDYKSMFQCETTWHDQYGILKYGVGQKFTNHIDDHINHHRRISTTFYMNENYDGGEICFPRFNLTHKPEKNELLIFPSTFVYNHSVLPVTNGIRYAVVSWLR
jgi:hypothetical protein